MGALKDGLPVTSKAVSAKIVPGTHRGKRFDNFLGPSLIEFCEPVKETRLNVKRVQAQCGQSQADRHTRTLDSFNQTGLGLFWAIFWDSARGLSFLAEVVSAHLDIPGASAGSPWSSIGHMAQ